MKSRSGLPRATTFFMLIGAFTCISMLAGCGLKGPLYMPNQEPSQQKASINPAIAPSNSTSSRSVQPASTVYIPPASK